MKTKRVKITIVCLFAAAALGAAARFVLPFDQTLNRSAAVLDLVNHVSFLAVLACLSVGLVLCWLLYLRAYGKRNAGSKKRGELALDVVSFALTGLWTAIVVVLSTQRVSDPFWGLPRPQYLAVIVVLAAVAPGNTALALANFLSAREKNAPTIVALTLAHLSVFVPILSIYVSVVV